MDKNVESLLARLAESVGFDSLELDENGECSLLFDRVLPVIFRFSADSLELQISAVLGVYLEEDELETLKALAKANYAWAGTGGGTLGANLQTREVLLCYREKATDLSWIRFEQILSGFLNTAFFWREKLAGGIKASGEALETAPPLHAISV